MTELESLSFPQARTNRSVFVISMDGADLYGGGGAASRGYKANSGRAQEFRTGFSRKMRYRIVIDYSLDKRDRCDR